MPRSKATAPGSESRLAPYPSPEALLASFREAVGAVGGRESNVGSSVQGHPLIRFDVGASDGPVVMLTALMHGTELIGALALLEVVRQLARRADPQVERLCAGAHFVIMPVVNPDALLANSSKLALGERASQRCNGNGVDLNRNFPRLTTRRLHHPCSGSRYHFSPYYAGPHPLSEPESRAVRGVAVTARPALSLAFHSFGNLLLYPWAYTTRENPRNAEYTGLGRVMNQALARFPYRVHQARQLYSVLGDMDDWLDAELGTMAFTIEVSRPDFRLADARHLLNPFCWMNPRRASEVVADVAPGVLALLSAHLGYGAGAAPAEPRRPLGRAGLEIAAK